MSRVKSATRNLQVGEAAEAARERGLAAIATVHKELFWRLVGLARVLDARLGFWQLAADPVVISGVTA